MTLSYVYILMTLILRGFEQLENGSKNWEVWKWIVNQHFLKFEFYQEEKRHSKTTQKLEDSRKLVQVKYSDPIFSSLDYITKLSIWWQSCKENLILYFKSYNWFSCF